MIRLLAFLMSLSCVEDVFASELPDERNRSSKNRGASQLEDVTYQSRHQPRMIVMAPYMNSATPEEMKMTLLLALKTFGPPLIAYSLDRVSLHWMENVLSHQQATGQNALKVFRALRDQRALYKGFLGRSLSIAPGRVLTLTTYFTILDALTGSLGTPAASVTAGIFAGIADAVATCPGENARTRATFNLPKALSARENYRGYWALQARSAGAPIILSGSTLMLYYDLLPTAINNGWYAGLITGALSQIITSPCDVVKNNLMSNPQKTYRNAISEMLASKSGYRGIGTKVARMSLGSSIVVGTMEYINEIISHQ